MPLSASECAACASPSLHPARQLFNISSLLVYWFEKIHPGRMFLQLGLICECFVREIENFRAQS